jgi:hypothetical protein
VLRPADFCRQLLAALEASEGRRRRRKRDTTPDAVGMGLKRWLLTETIRCDPEAGAFEAWLFERVRPVPGSPSNAAPGAALAMGRALLEEWRLAGASSEFRSWLEQGAPSEDA